jgi:sulfane dehydrogenase subunit SoxC
VDSATWRLRVGGLVERELSLSLEDLRARPAVTHAVTLECAGNGRVGMSPRPISQPWILEAVGTAEWTGVPLAGLLEEAGVEDGAIEVLFHGLDKGVEAGVAQHYERSLVLAEARRDEVLLAYAMNGQPLLPQHGFPLRLVVPGWYGMTSVKWLDRITLIDEPFEGYQQAHGYRRRQLPDEKGEPLSRMEPRSLMIPPGVPEYATRERRLGPGPVTVRGRAWSGLGKIARLEVSADGAATWSDARLAPEASPWAWRAWEWEWDARPGDYELCCRTTDAAGNAQPLEAPWNLGGYVNNEVQRVPVVVADSQLDV